MLRSNWSKIFLTAVIIVGIYLGFRNLWGAVYLDEDEARAFTLLDSGPMLYLIFNPFFLLFRAEHGAFYAAALVGVLNLFLFYRLVRVICGKKAALYALAFYAIFPMRLNFARSLYPQVIIDFFLLLLLTIFLYGLKNKRPWPMILCGAFTACLVYVHPSAYSLITGFTAAALIFWRMERGSWDLPQLIRWSLRFVLGLAATYLLLERLLLSIDPGYYFTERLLGVASHIRAETVSSGNNLIPFLTVLWSEIVFSPVSVFRGICVTAAVIFIINHAVRLRKRRMKFILIFCVIALTVFLCDVIIGAHEVRIRHFNWLTIPLSLALGYASFNLLKIHWGLKRRLVIAGISLFLFTSCFDGYMVTTEVFKTKEIEDWLIANNATDGVLTFLHLQRIPYIIPPVGRHGQWKQQAQKFQIMWPFIYKAYTEGKCSYIIPSGMSSNATLTEGDIMLKYPPAEKSWQHPYSKFKYRIFGLKTKKPDNPLLIRFYRLGEVFSDRNVGRILAEDQSNVR